MNENSEAIVLYCSHLLEEGEGVLPLGPKEWNDLSDLLVEKNLTPAALLGLSEGEIGEKLSVERSFAGRLVRLASRRESIARELENYSSMGIEIVTRADAEYPASLKRVFGNKSPLLFYYAGDLALLSRPAVGYVGSRKADEDALLFTDMTVKKTAERGYGAVSGGAKGVDSAAELAATGCRSFTVEYLADSIISRLKVRRIARAVKNDCLLLLSAIGPDAGFSVGAAMMRNRLIYAHSAGTVVVRSDLNTGGTWAGAVDNLNNGWCSEFCWKNDRYSGNLKLIEKGAIPIDEGWDGDPSSPKQNRPVQASLFDPHA